MLLVTVPPPHFKELLPHHYTYRNNEPTGSVNIINPTLKKKGRRRSLGHTCQRILIPLERLQPNLNPFQTAALRSQPVELSVPGVLTEQQKPMAKFLPFICARIDILPAGVMESFNDILGAKLDLVLIS